MKIMRMLPLAGVSLLATATALQAQDAGATEETVLGTITVISQGKDNVEATGGTVVTPEDIEKLKPANVSELFSRESSVTVSGGGGPSKRIHVLGMEQSNLAVTVDGVPQTATSWHHTGSNVIDPVFLKRVEVEAGAAAADSGFAAAAGAVRYETVGALDLLDDGKDFGARLGLSWGSNGRGVSGNAAAYGRKDGFDWFVMGHGAGGNNYKNGDGVEILGTEPAARNILGKLGYEFDGHRIELGYERSRDKADRLVKMNMGFPNDELHPLEVARDAVNLKYISTAPTDLWDPEATLYYTRNDYWRPDYLFQSNNNGNMALEEDLWGGKVQNTFIVDYGKITAGIDFGRHDYFTDNYGRPPRSGAVRRYRDFHTTQIGAFAQGRFEFDNGFNVSAGARYDGHRFVDWDDNTFSDSGASVNATLAYRFNDHVEVFAGASRTWLGYQLRDYAYLHARNDAFFTDPDFDTASAQNYKVGANFGGDDWNAGITFFDTRIRDLPVYGTASLSNDPNEQRSRGVTLNASYRWSATRIGATFTHARVTAGNADILPNSGTFMPIGDMATLFIDHEIPDYNLKLGATVAWAGKIDAIDTFYEQPAYTVVNAYAEWTPSTFENMTVRLGVENLFDETYYERSGYAASSARGGLEPVYAPGRTFTLHTALRF